MFPGLADARIQQSLDAPGFNVDVDRTRAQYVGITERDVTNSMVVNLAGTSQVQPTFWLNPDNGVSYSIVMQTPQYQVDSLNALQNLPITAAGRAAADARAPSPTSSGWPTPAVYSQYNIQPMVQIYGTSQGRDLGAVAADVQKILNETAKDAPKGAQVAMLGQVKTMNSAFSGLLFGLLGAIVLIYLLIVVNFQSWADPFVIITALPAALAGIVWMLFATGTTLSVPALTGAIMCMGVATANSVLVISFARERLEQHGDAVAAAIEAGLRPLPPGADDRAGDDHRHAADGAGLRRRRRAERAARPRRGRRPDLRDGRHADFRPRRLQHHAPTPRRSGRSGDRRTTWPPDPPAARHAAVAPRAQHRRLSVAGVAAVIVVMGITTRKMADAKLREWTESQAVPAVAVAAAGYPRQADDVRASRPARSLHAGADLSRASAAM